MSGHAASLGLLGNSCVKGARAASARTPWWPLSHTLETTDLKDLLEQRIDIKTLGQKEGLIELLPLGELGTILCCENCHSSNNLQVRQKEMSYKSY